MGTRIQLHSLCNNERDMPPGLCGTVVGVDDQPSLLMKWDNGRSLSLMPFEDSFTVIQEQQPGFVAKLVGCFADGQTDEQLIAEVNAVFGTDLDPEDFSAIMNNTFIPENMPITNWWKLPKPSLEMWAASLTGAGTVSKAGWSVCAQHWTSSKSPSLSAFAPRSRANSLIAIVIFNSLSAETG